MTILYLSLIARRTVLFTIFVYPLNVESVIKIVDKVNILHKSGLTTEAVCRLLELYIDIYSNDKDDVFQER